MDLLIPAIELHQAKLGRTPRLVAADAGFYSAKNEAAAKAKGVKRVCIPNRSSKSAARKREQKKRWFRNGQRWRTGCEGRRQSDGRTRSAQLLAALPSNTSCDTTRSCALQMEALSPARTRTTAPVGLPKTFSCSYCAVTGGRSRG